MQKKLTINRESLRSLQEVETSEARGGDIYTLPCGLTSRAIECQPGYTCYPGCIFL